MTALVKTIQIEKALRHLRKDAQLAPYIKRFPKPVFSRQTSHGKPIDPFYALCESIIFQQLSGKAADTILGRFIALFPRKHLTPRALLKLEDSAIRAAGISSQKLSYLKDLALKFTDGTITLEGLEEWEDEKVREHLIAVKGIGRWTADMFLISYLHRADVLPTGDLGIQKGFRRLFNLKALPNATKMEKLAKDWAPYRSVASRYLWMIADDKLPVR